MSTILKRAAARQSGLAQTIGIYAALSVVAVLIGWHLMGAQSLDVPVLYQGDALLTISLIKRMMENHWVYSTWVMGAPFGSSIYDYPIPDSGSLLVLKVFGLIFGNATAAYNAYYFAGFGLNAVAAYAVFRELRLSRSLSFAGGLIFTCLPFHFLRVGHLFYTWYFAAPAFTWFALRAYRGSFDFFNGRPGRSQITDAALLFVLTCFGVYYAFFGVLAVLTAGLARFLRHRTLVSIRGPVVAAIIVFGGVVVNVAPTLLYTRIHGPNPEVAARNPAESEIYGLKIDQLLLPRIGHRIPAFAKTNERYASSFPLINENATASLGIFGAIGFLALLVMAFTSKDREDDRLTLLSILTVSFVIFCAVGGMSAMFAIVVSPLIRAWNRASVFVGFFSIAASLVIVQMTLGRFGVKRLGVPAVAAALCVLALFDQTTPACEPCSTEQRETFNADSAFVASVENAVPHGSMIYQLPYMAFPEVPPLNRLAAYDQATGFIHSRALRWSYGGMKGRQGDLFFRALAEKPIEQQLDTVRQMGFAGLWIDRRGYEDDGKSIAADVSKKLGHGPALVSANQFFFVLSDG